MTGGNLISELTISGHSEEFLQFRIEHGPIKAYRAIVGLI